jgi:hypothetical protein
MSTGGKGDFNNDLTISPKMSSGSAPRIRAINPNSITSPRRSLASLPRAGLDGIVLVVIVSR